MPAPSHGAVTVISGELAFRAAAQVHEERGGFVLAVRQRRREHVVADAETAAEVLVTRQPILTSRNRARRCAVCFGAGPGLHDIATAAGLGRDRSPLHSGRRGRERGPSLLRPCRVCRVFGCEPVPEHRGMHGGDERDGRIDSGECSQHVAHAGGRLRHRLPGLLPGRPAPPRAGSRSRSEHRSRPARDGVAPAVPRVAPSTVGPTPRRIPGSMRP